MKVLMLPTLQSQKKHESGIKRVLEAYHRHGPDFGVQFVDSGAGFDIRVVHAGATTEQVDVCMLHGMYFSADYDVSDAEYRTNARIVKSLRTAKEVTVPSTWVAETFQRDMRFTPHIIPHGVEWREWQHKERCRDYVLWNKNRHKIDVCDATSVKILAERFPRQRFLTTFAPDDAPPNVKTTGLVPHAEMKPMVQGAAVYLSTTKETFCIGNLEAMASGVPVLGWANGGNLDLIETSVNGYLARPGDYDDLAAGLDYCLKYRKALGDNGREMAKYWTWQATMEKLVEVFEVAMVEEPPTVGVVIPVFNKTEQELRRAVESVANQRFRASKIVVIDDGSRDEAIANSVVDSFGGGGHSVELVRQDNQGVAIARNRGIDVLSNVKYVCCLDSDDWLEPDYLRVCIEALERDRSLGIAYTGMRTHLPDGSQNIGRWPGQADADKQMKGHNNNQVPTCTVFRRKVWERLGGYRQRYAPTGAGSEDAEFWLRHMAYGWRAEEITPEPLFNYSWLSGHVSSDPNYRETDWIGWHPFTVDKQYPFAAVTKPARISHPVRQYDEPVISVIIPVGLGHEGLVIDALDSLEAQTFRKWEAIVVWDTNHHLNLEDGTTPNKPEFEMLRKAYPYIRWVFTAEAKGGNGVYGHGAGFARNRGAEIARAPFLLWLDADDWLHRDAMRKMLRAWNETENVIYSDYVKHMHSVTREQAENSRQAKKLVSYDEAKQQAVVKFRAYDFDCQRAIRQPEKPAPYYWCLTTCLVPKAWHEKIGGFDENMESWEDADYAFRMVRAGHCFTRVTDELIMVRTWTGQRLNRGLQIAPNLVKYMQDKYATGNEVDDTMCNGCGGNKVATSQSVAAKAGTDQRLVSALPDEDMVLIKYGSANRGKHHVYGNATNPATGKRFFYGHRAGGEEFLVHKNDVYHVDKRTGRVTISTKFVPIKETLTEVKAPEPEPVQAPPEPELIQEVMTTTETFVAGAGRFEAAIPESPNRKEVEAAPSRFAGIQTQINSGPVDASTGEVLPQLPFNFQKLPGVTPAIARQLEVRGLTTVDEVFDLGVDGLQEIRGIGEARARKIIEYLGQKSDG